MRNNTRAMEKGIGASVFGGKLTDQLIFFVRGGVGAQLL